MKNYIPILFMLGAASFICQTPKVFSQNQSTSGHSVISIFEVSPEQVKMNITGTGETTGIIAHLNFRNLTDEDIFINIPPVFIPSDGRHQSYIVPLPGTVTLPSGTTTSPAPDIIFPIEGYCADVNLPPVPLGGTVITPDNWVQPRLNNFDQDGFNPKIIGEDIGGELIDLYVGEGSGGQPVIVSPFDGILPTNPLPLDVQDLILEPRSISTPTDSPDPESDIIVDPVFEEVEIPRIIIDPTVQPELFADLALDAVLKITDAVDELIAEDVLETPLSGRADERETIIQQTFWIYTSALKGTSYEYDDFREILIDQFNEVTGMNPDEAPESIQEEFESGAGSMWDAFVFVGEQAKVVKQFTPHSDQIRDAFGRDPAEVKPHTDTAAEAAADSIGAEAYTRGEDISFKDGSEPHDAGHEAAHVPQSKGESRLVNGTSEVFEPADPPCVCEEVNVVSEGIAYAMDDIGSNVDRTKIEGSTVTSLTPYIEFHPPEVTVSCPDHCPSSIEYVHRRTIDEPYRATRSRVWKSGPTTLGTDGEPKTFIFETTVTASCGGVPCPPMEMRREIEVVETNDCCTEIRSMNNGRIVFDAGDRSVVISGNSLIVHPNNPWERSRSFNFPYNIEAIFCNLGSDQVFGLTESEMEASSAGESYRQANLTISELPERDNELVHMEINSPYKEEILRNMPRTFPASYVISFQQQQNGDEFSFAMTMDKETCRTMIQVLQNGRLIESIDGVVQN